MKLYIYSFVIALLAFSAPVKAAEEGIAVIVNDSVITYSDISNRVKLIMQSAGMPNTKEMRAKITPQITNMLIEEQLKLQEATALDMEITQQEVEEGFGRIAAQNNIPAEQFKAMLMKSGINMNTLYDQIRSEIAWGRVVAARIRPRVDVTETDIDAELEILKENIGGAQYRISEIFLSVDAATQEVKIKQTAQKLYQQLQKQPQSFSAVAQQFSQAAGATQGGDLGWVETGQIDDDLENALNQMAKGNISAPIRTDDGYHIVLLKDKRSLSTETLPSRDDILSKIGNQRLERQAKSYLLDLKASAFIENRV